MKRPTHKPQTAPKQSAFNVSATQPPSPNPNQAYKGKTWRKMTLGKFMEQCREKGPTSVMKLVQFQQADATGDLFTLTYSQ